MTGDDVAVLARAVDTALMSFRSFDRAAAMAYTSRDNALVVLNNAQAALDESLEKMRSESPTDSLWRKGPGSIDNAAPSPLTLVEEPRRAVRLEPEVMQRG